ncbi:P-loop containing nucleoside triphosphate hydrolase protein, partial [Flagelloscypha sp. PMI_526]
VVGAHRVGKSAMIVRAAIGLFDQDYDPYMDDSWRFQRQFEDYKFLIELIDTPGPPEYEGLLQANYREARVLVFCFSLVDPKSFEHVMDKLHSFRTYARSGTPVILVGTKSDLWSSEQEIERLRQEHRAPISLLQMQAMTEEIGASSYHLCSAKEDKGVEHVITCVIKEFMRRQPIENKKVQKLDQGKRKRGGPCVVM